jgi:hypothetical protein
MTVVHGVVAPHPPPLHPVNVNPGSGLAVNVTELLTGKDATQVPPQSMPVGLLVTVPVPEPIFVIVKVAGGLNVAVTDRLASMRTEQEPVPLQSPLNVDPAAGVAVRVTGVPGAKPALQVPGQDMPLGLLVTVPVPFTVTVSVNELGAGEKVAVTV